MDSKSLKRAMVVFAAGAFIAAAGGPSYAGCWGTCTTGVGSLRSFAPRSQYASKAGTLYKGTWGVDLAKGETFAPRHESEILAYGSMWGADWLAEISSATHFASHAGAVSQTN